jgi:hypothetical protein
MMTRQIVLGTLAMFALGGSIASANTFQYQYCITGDRGQGNILVNAGPVNFGREWYKAKATQSFCMATGSHECTALDYDPKVCGKTPQQTLTFSYINGDQLSALFSGNPATMGQTVVELAVNTPGAAVVAVGGGAAKVAAAVGNTTATGAVAVANGSAAAGKAVAGGAAKVVTTVGSTAATGAVAVGNGTAAAGKAVAGGAATAARAVGGVFRHVL